jgi:tRNA pseudouridine38-40 synthase
MKTFKITIAYDGTDYVGWQRQASGISIQGVLEDALRDLDQREVIVTGAGRTDAGVHAFGQVASLAIERPMDAAVLVRALNARLPPTIQVVDAEEAAERFHARFDAARKSYRYRIWNAEVPSPFERAYAWHLSGALDVDAMREAATLVVGRRDFAALQAAGSATATTVREVYSSIVQVVTEGGEVVDRQANRGRLIVYNVTGNGFLRHMVRNIVGSLVEIGRGRRPVSWMTEILGQRSRALAGPTAPPHGLALVAVEYGLQSLSTNTTSEIDG